MTVIEVFYWLMAAELDAMKRHEWRILPLLRHLPDNVGEQIFIWIHIPLFVLFFWVSWLGTESIFAMALSLFAILHVGLTWLLRNHPAFEYNNPSSWLLICLPGLFGGLHLVACAMQ